MLLIFNFLFMQTPIELVQLFGQSLATGDVPTAFSLLSSDVLWHQPGNHKYA